MTARTVRARSMALGVAAFVAVIVLWEAVKVLGGAMGGKVLRLRTGDQTMPHVWTILSRLGQDEDRAGERSVGVAVLDGAWYTLRIAGAGLVMGAVVGLLLALLMQRFEIVERGLLPYVVLSQTIPLVALAPLVVAWGGRLVILGWRWPAWMSVAVIAAYLSFCPIAVGALKGLQSPAPESIELMRSMAASSRATTWKLRFPAAVPFLVPAFRLAAASAIVGGIVAEISTGTRGGIGRLILEYSREATSDPAKVYTAMLGASLLGLVVAGLVALVDIVALRHRPKEAL